MSKLLTLTTALALTLAVPAVASAQNGNGNGKGGGKSEQSGGRGGEDRGRGGGQERGRGGDDRGPGRGGEQQRADRADRGPDRERVVVRADRGDGGVRVDVRRDDDRRDDRGDRRFERSTDGGVVVLRRDDDRGLIQGCPPGLAKKDNGCLPPGQARKIARAQYDYPRYDYVWGRRGDDSRYRYEDGYLYRTNSTGSILGYLPVLGGALSVGNPWPAQYQYQEVPQYYSSYYGLNQPYDYRYADGIVYGLNPQTQAIQQVAALLTGQNWNVGQQMPSGYDVYNVPYAYRGQYADTTQSMYRYNDGYVYQVDPKTQLVQSVIQLLT
jgi:hypothetical protein